MADFDPQQSAENEANNAPKRDDARNQSCDASGPQDYSGAGCGCGHGQGYGKYNSYDGESLDTSNDFDTSRADSFVADWSGAEKSLAEQAESFETRKAEMDQGMPQQFWVDLVRSQKPESTTETVVPVTVRGESLSGESQSGESQQLWSDLVRSQQASAAELGEAAVTSSHSKPTGMGWAEDEASEWAPPEREYEPAGAAAEPVEAGSGRRDDVEWATPVSAQDDWETVRTEALTAEGKPHSLMEAAVEAAAALPEPKQKKTRAARKPAAKKPAKAKKTVAKKPAKKPVKKAAAKKVVKKTPPAPKIVKDPTRRAA